MGLSLTCSLEVLATRTKSNKQSGVSSVIFVKDSGENNQVNVIMQVTWTLQHYHVAGEHVWRYCSHPSSWVSLSIVQCNVPKVSHKVVVENTSSLAGRSKGHVHVRQDYTVTVPRDQPVFKQTSKNKTQAKSFQNNKPFKCKHWLLQREMRELCCEDGKSWHWN